MNDNCKLLYVYSDSCGYCNDFNPTWDNFVSTFKKYLYVIYSKKFYSDRESFFSLTKK